MYTSDTVYYHLSYFCNLNSACEYGRLKCRLEYNHTVHVEIDHMQKFINNFCYEYILQSYGSFMILLHSMMQFFGLVLFPYK